MKHRIHFENTQKEKAPFRGYQSALRRAIEKTLEKESFPVNAEISVTLVSREEIRRLNREFRETDRETDVLSFPLLEEGQDAAEEMFEGACQLGDVIVCPDVIYEQAKAFGTTYRQEFCLMVIHSTLHLLGWDHLEEKEKKDMFALQETVLRELQEGSIQTEAN